MRMSTRKVLHEYRTIAKKIFGFRNRRLDLSFGNTKLEKCVKSTTAAHVDECDKLMISNKFGVDKGLCFVVSLSKAEDSDGNTPTLFRSCKRNGNKSAGEFPDCEIWEAARATTAAPRYFAPAQITVDGKVQYFMDGVLKWNNPASLLLEEAESHFGPHRTLGCLVGLGTGLSPSPFNDQGGGKFGKSWSISELLRVATDVITDAEPVHQSIDERLKAHGNSYFWFTVSYVKRQERIKIHEYKRMVGLCQDTEEYLKRKNISDMLNELVNFLTNKGATSLTLQAARESRSEYLNVVHVANFPGRANFAETSMEQITYKLQHRKSTSPDFTGRKDVLKLLDDWFRPRLQSPHPRRGLLSLGGWRHRQDADRTTFCR